MPDADLISGLNPLDQWAKPPPPIALSPDLQARPVQPQGSPDTVVPPPSGQAGQTANDPLAPVRARVASGESGGPDPYHELYGGGQFGFPSWAGASGPQGTTHAAGKYQFEPATWTKAAQGWMSANPGQPPPDFNNARDQDKVFDFHATQTYGHDKNGRTLAEAAATGAVDYSRLAGQWPSLHPNHDLYKGWADEDRAHHQGEFDSSTGMQREFMRLATEELPGSAKRAELLQKAQESADRANDSFEAMRKVPPVYKPLDAMENFGSATVMIAALGGLFAKRPLTASLAAAGLAMQARQSQNWDQFKVANEQWKTQAEMGLQQARLAHDQIREVMEDQRLAESDRQAKLHNVMSGLQFTQQQQAQWQNHYDRTAAAFQAHLDRAEREKNRVEESNAKLEGQRLSREEHKAAMGLPQQYLDTLDEQSRQANPGKELSPETHLENIRRAEADTGKGKTAGGLEVSKTFDVLNEKGDVVRTVMARERRDQPGFIDSDTGEPIRLDKSKGEHLRQVTPTSSGGGRAGAQVLRQQIGGREVLSDLQNAVNLPVGTTIGPLGTVNTGPGIMDAVRGDLVRKMTDQDEQFMQASMASMTRELSILMSPVYGGNWAAQQIDPLIPKSQDTLPTVMFKMARLAQSADNALEGLQHSPILSNDQKSYALELKAQIAEAIPWSPKQAMDFGLRGSGSGQSFGDFVRAGKLGGDARGGTPTQAHTATGPNGVKIHSLDGVNWLNEDGTPYK